MSELLKSLNPGANRRSPPMCFPETDRSDETVRNWLKTVVKSVKSVLSVSSGLFFGQSLPPLSVLFRSFLLFSALYSSLFCSFLLVFNTVLLLWAAGRPLRLVTDSRRRRETLRRVILPQQGEEERLCAELSTSGRRRETLRRVILHLRKKERDSAQSYPSTLGRRRGLCA